MNNVQKIIKSIFHNDFEGAFCKSMWRLTGGNRTKCFSLIKDIAVKHYSFNPTEEDIDNALAEMGGGCEIEWLSY